MDNKKVPLNPDDIKVDIPSELKKGVYANTVNISATNTEIAINFIYVNPADEPLGTLVSRVIIPPVFADNLINILQNIKKQLEESKE